MQLIYPPCTIEQEDDKDDIQTPHPPRVPPGLCNDDGQRLRIDNCPTGTTDALQSELVFARLHIHKTDILLICRLAPVSVSYLVVIGYVEMVAHVDTFKQQVEGSLTVGELDLSFLKQ